MQGKTQGWLFFAENSLMAAESFDLMVNHRLTGEVAFNCQQAVEKYLKTFLVEHDSDYNKTHNLPKLHSMVTAIKDFGFDEDMIQKLSALYTIVRYSDSVSVDPSGTLPTTEEAQEYLAFARLVAQTISAELGVSVPAK
jgi:HEPN domain-containing protein